MSLSDEVLASTVAPPLPPPPLRIAVLQLPQLPTAFLSDPEKRKFQYICWLHKQLLLTISPSTSVRLAESAAPQMPQTVDKKATRDKTVDLIILPEMWNCPIGAKYFARFAEAFDEENLEKATEEISNYFNLNSAEDAEDVDVSSRTIEGHSASPPASPFPSASLSSSSLLFSFSPPSVPPLQDVPFSPSTISCMSLAFLMYFARRHNVWIVGGSLPEKVTAIQEEKGEKEISIIETKDENKKERIYNTCPVINTKGQLVCKHRKIHLFDVCIPGGIVFRESDSLCSGGDITTFEMDVWGVVGVAICYDIRFPELSTCMKNRGANLLIFPAAFSNTTGPPHWELLLRSRALDNQCFVVGCSPAPSKSGEFAIENGYMAHGYSQVISPWGDQVEVLENDAGVIICEVDLDLVQKVRNQIPISKQKRSDLYRIVDVKFQA